MTVSLFLLLASLQAPPRAEQMDVLRAGTTLSRSLAAEQVGEGLGFCLEAEGTVTLTLESLDFEPSLEAYRLEGGERLESSVAAGPALAWLALVLQKDGAVGIRVRSLDERGGVFTLNVSAGLVELPPGIARHRAFLAQSVRIAQRAERQDDPERAARFYCLASEVSFGLQDARSAREHAETALWLAERAGSQALVVRARLSLALALQAQGELARARELLHELLPALEQELAAAQPGADESARARRLAVTLANLGDVTRAVEGHRAALPYYERSTELARRIGEPSLVGLLSCKLGTSLDELEDEEGARRAIEEGLRIAEQEPGRIPLLADALTARGRHRLRHGELEGARRDLERARALPLESLPKERATLLGTLSNAYVELGLYERALEVLRELEELCRAQGIRDHEVPIRLTRARIAFSLGQHVRAKQALDEALHLIGGGVGSGEQAAVLMQLGTVHKSAGASAEAAARLDEALESCVRAGDRRREASVHHALGHLRAELGEHDEALASFARAEALGAELDVSEVVAMARNGRAFVHFHRGELGEARALAAEAARMLEERGRHEAAIDARETLAQVLLAQGETEAVAEELRAAEAFFATQARQRLDPFSAAGLRSRFATWGEIAQDLAASRARVLAPDEARAVIAAGWREASRSKARRLLEGMLAGPAGEPELASLRLGTRTALVELAEGRELLRAYVLYGEELRLVELGPREPLERAAAEQAAALSHARPDLHGDFLHERLIAPWRAGLPPEVTTVVIVPTPSLASLPFEALPLPREAGEAQASLPRRYLMDELCVVHAPSSATLAALLRRAPSRGPARFFVLGDPLYAGELPERAQGALALARQGEPLIDFTRLKGTRDEVWEIARLLLAGDPESTHEESTRLLALRDARDGELSTRSLELRLGSRVRRELLQENLRPFTHIHVAAHGHLDARDPRRSGLVLSWEEGTQGLFPLEEILRLRLDAELVVLSACDSARGPIVRGEGVLSLVHGFLEAGARAVVASLWSVEDRNAADLMRELYQRLIGEGQHPARALREAKLAFRRSGTVRGVAPLGAQPLERLSAEHPYFWAPFVYVGAPPP